jgi:hypothetical protein
MILGQYLHVIQSQFREGIVGNASVEKHYLLMEKKRKKGEEEK